MKRLTLSAFGVLVASLFVSGFGCELLTAPDRSKIDTGGTGGGTTTATGGGGTGGTTGGTGGVTGGTGGTTGGTGGTTGGTGGSTETPCQDPSECPDTGNPCITATCVNNVCGTEAVAAGTQAGTQVAGDCQVFECNGAGTLETHPDNNDLPDDMNACTDDTCVGGVKTFTPVAAGDPCNSGTGTLCDGAGSCVECLVADDCPGADTECQTRTCDMGVCGVSNAMQGTPVASQTMGDCKKNQCDGNGAIEAVPDDLDVVNDGNDCTDNTCLNGVPQLASTMINTPCGAGGTLKCDGNGACVGCTSAADCSNGGNACLDAVCNSGTCGTASKMDGTACNDGDACSQTDTCQNGACTGSNPVVCSAQDQCHDAGTCNAATGQCSNPAKANGASCSDGNGCTTNDTCQAGACQAGTAVTCTALDQCHDAGTCNPATGVCSNPNKSDGSSCSDGNSCTQTDTCQNGSCTGANPVVCSAQDQCHDAGTCNPATGVCSNPSKSDGSSCNDNDSCTQTDTCQSGACTGGNPVVCTASDQCHDAGTCSPATGMCSNPPKANGSTCSDGDGCTTGDTCQSGACQSGTPVTCTAQDQCHDAGTCNPATGLCSNPNKTDGTACNDSNLCTQTDTCQSGTCTGGNPVVCTASDQCHDAGTCSPATGVCSNPNKANGSTCSDGNGCTQTDTCQNGSCTGANPVVCSAQDACHVAGTCDTGTGMCSNPNGPDNTPCPGGVCQSGTCTQTCGNGVKDGLETGVDCGGTCPACANGQACNVNADCSSGHCLGNVCVQCAVANDCPGVDNDCQTRTCDAGTHTCGFSFQPNGTATPPATQTTGDCKEKQCDGAGNTVTVNKDTDLPVDNLQCTTDVCTNGVPSNPTLPVNSSCNQNGGTVCNAAGQCVAAFTVTAISPLDAATGVVSPQLVNVTFSAAPAAATLTGQTAPGPCTGSVQLSADNFASCIGFGSASAAIVGSVATFVPAPGLSLGRSYKIKVKSSVTNAAGLPLQADVTQATGFTIETLPATCGASSVVISQFYGGGGSVNGVYKSDFVELYNAGATTVDLSTYALQYASTQGTTWTKGNIVSASPMLAPGRYFLVKLSTGSGVLDLTGEDGTVGTTIAANATVGKIALTSNQTALTGACPAGGAIVDFLGYGTGTNCFEGAAPALSPSTATSVVRKGFGCTDTNSNPSDFGVGQVNPRNSTFRQPLNETGQSGQAGQLGNEADYCVLFSPATITAANGTMSPQILGRIYEAGVTEAAGGNASVTAQVGYGPAVANPEVSLFTAWTTATFTQQDGPFGNDDEYGATFTLPAAGTYAYAFRFSLDGGNRWTYCDLDMTASGGDSGAGANGGVDFQSSTMGVLVSQ